MLFCKKHCLNLQEPDLVHMVYIVLGYWFDMEIYVRVLVQSNIVQRQDDTSQHWYLSAFAWLSHYITDSLFDDVSLSCLAAFHSNEPWTLVRISVFTASSTDIDSLLKWQSALFKSMLFLYIKEMLSNTSNSPLSTLVVELGVSSLTSQDSISHFPVWP